MDAVHGYFPHGALQKATLGNGLTETAAYNNRLQPCRMNVNSSGTYLTQCTDAVLGGNVLDFNYGFNAGTANNGNIASWAASGAQVFSRSYTYDGDDRRVQKSNGKLYWYGGGSDPLTETDLSGTASAEFIFFNGKRTARLDLPSAVVHYYFSDHLGSADVVTSSAGAIQDESDYYPFGGEHVVVSSSGNTYKFTAKERDAETGLDYLMARYYSSGFGRFYSPDEFTGGPIDAISPGDPLPPGPLPYADIANPQSLNKYAFVYNNPLRFIDPTGHDPIGWSPPTGPPEGEMPAHRGECSCEGLGGDYPGTSVNSEQAQQEQNQTQNQQNQQTQNSQQSTAQTQQLATSGINPNYQLPTFDVVLKKVSDFSAGAGDCLTGRCLFLGTSMTEKVRQLNGADSVVDKGSGSYLGGKITGGVVGTGIASLAVANAVGLGSKVAIHGAHHAFKWLGGARLAHIQITLWLAGVKGSDINFRIPLPWK